MSKPTFQTVTAGLHTRFRGTNQQTDTGLLWAAPTFLDHNRLANRVPGAAVAAFSIQNRSGQTAAVGFGARIPNHLWIAGQWDDTGGATQYTDDTADAQSTATGDFALETTTNNDGYVVASQVPFNAVTINVTTASVDAVSVARAARYSNTAGTGWTSLANVYVQDSSATNYATGEALLVFAPPLDWGKITANTGDIPNGYYAINVRATDAPGTTAGVAAAIELWNIFYIKESVTDNTTLEYIAAYEPWYLPYCTGLAALVSDVTAVGSNVVAQVRAA